MMQPRIELLDEKKLVGKRLTMSFLENKTSQLWKSFMPEKKDVASISSADLYSAEVYPPHFFENFNPNALFDKWAAVAVNDATEIPKNMEVLMVPNGLYAIFIHKGPASDGPETYQYIFQTWIPNSQYIVDTRPDLAIMGTKYKSNDPDSEEEICIPIKERLSFK